MPVTHTAKVKAYPPTATGPLASDSPPLLSAYIASPTETSTRSAIVFLLLLLLVSGNPPPRRPLLLSYLLLSFGWQWEVARTNMMRATRGSSLT
ncbi:hypothetical protein GUJ93_ZPchr0005g14259 [Zizania palustris]|uniref:Uncharacterized protein n=1 Tax=Zizania palustris TaxID=103762 RepID=A0A8J5SQD3_ZIZPA|nr:hypothetical protein GUJ93_ZPchr0005g14259 [Zizania palustris]